VGKSSLLNALEPELRLETRELRRTGKGRHTTTRATLYRLRGGALVVDTPGVREIATGPLPEEIVDDAFPDIATLAVDCRFRNCRHGTEPACAVQAAADDGTLPPARLRSYLRLRAEARAGG
jgi:ribosome biogenesis GTPase